MQDKISQMTERQVKAKPLAELAEALATEFSINVPVIDEESILPQRRDVDIDLPHNRMRIGYDFTPAKPVKGTEITISVPFSGDAEMFRVHPSSHTMDYPRGRIVGQKIIFSRSGQILDGPIIRHEFDNWLNRIKQHLDDMRRELGNFNQIIKGEAFTALEARANKFKSDDDLVNDLGFCQPKRQA